MSVLNSIETYRNLKKKGFEDSITKSIDHKYLDFFFEGVKILETKISHGGKRDIDDYLIGKMSRQCNLNKEQFIDLAKCPMKKDEFVSILKEKGLI
jgi:hypothetical protein